MSIIRLMGVRIATTDRKTAAKTITSGAMAAEALHIFEKHKINDLIVVDEKKHPVGIIDGQDLPRVKAV